MALSGSSSWSSESDTYSDTWSTFDLVTPSSTALSGYSTSTTLTSSSSAGSSTSLSALDQTSTTLDLKTSASPSLMYTSSTEGSSQDISLSNSITAISSSIVSSSSPSSSSSSPSSSTLVNSGTSFSEVSTTLVAPYYSSSFSNSTLITSHHTSSPSSQRSWSSSNVPSTTSTAISHSSSTSEQYLSASSADSGFSVSQDAQSVYYIYTQMYEITGSTTTFNTGILSTVELAKSASTSFSVPQSTSTKDIQFYQNWLDGSLGNSGAQSQNATKNKIIGGVVGGVGGLIICSLVVWLMFSRRRKNKDKEVNTSFSSEIGRRVGYPLPSPSLDANEEKIITPDNSTGAIFSRIKNKAKAFPQISRNVNDTGEDNNNDDNPFQNEFNFEARLPPPPVPPPRKTTMQYPIPGGEATSQTDGRYSYVSSMSDSSFASSAGDYSTMSSTSIRLDSEYNNNNNVPGSSQGFLREVI